MWYYYCKQFENCEPSVKVETFDGNVMKSLSFHFVTFCWIELYLIVCSLSSLLTAVKYYKIHYLSSTQVFSNWYILFDSHSGNQDEGSGISHSKTRTLLPDCYCWFDRPWIHYTSTFIFCYCKEESVYIYVQYD